MPGKPEAMQGDPVSRATERTFGLLSRLRGKRIVHPHGVGFEGELAAKGQTGVDLFGAAPRPVIARLSRSVGLPERLRDPCGIGLRIPNVDGDGAHLDLLLVSSARVPGARHLLLPARDFASSHYSTLLPYRLDGRLVVFGAGALTTEGSAPTLAELARRDRADLSFLLMMASPWGGWHEIATLELGRRIPDRQIEALTLDPSNTGGRLQLAGLFNRLRRPAYRGSQRGRLLSPQDLPRGPASASPDGRREDAAPGSAGPSPRAP